MVDQAIIDEYQEQITNDTIYQRQEGELVGEREYEEQQRDQSEQNRLESRSDVHATTAKIGPLEFVGDFSDPDVNIKTSRDVRDHSVVSGVADFGSDKRYVVHPKSTRPMNIEIIGWIREGQLGVVDELIGGGPERGETTMVGVRTGRWTGTAVIKEIDVDYSRVYHEHHGPIFETTISLVAVNKDKLPNGFGGDPYNGPDWGYIDGEPVGGTAYRIEQEQQEETRINNLFSSMDVSAVVGKLAFIDEFEDPDVRVNHTRDTVDHEIVSGHDVYRDEGIDYVVQVMGKNPANISIKGWIRESQTETAEALPELDRTPLISGRWSGIVTPLDVNIDYSRDRQPIDSGSVFEITIELLGLKKGELPENIPDPTVF